MCAKGCSKIQNNKLNTYDWLCGVPDAENATDFVEVQFKNTRKGYYLNNLWKKETWSLSKQLLDTI